MLPVSWEQWDRLKDRVTALGNPRVDMIDYEAAAWGVCVPCVASFIVLLSQDDRPTWALLVYGIVGAAALVTGALLRRFQSQEKDVRREDASNIVDEMKTIEQAYQRGSTR